MLKRAVLALILATALGTTIVACGSDSKTVDTKDGKVTVNGDGKDAKVTVKGKDNASFTFNQGSVPDGFPSEVPLPKGLKLKTGAGGSKGAKQFFTLGYGLGSKRASDALSDYKDQLESAGFTIKDGGSLSNSGGSFQSLQATGNGWTVIASSIAGGSGDTAVMSVIVSSET